MKHFILSLALLTGASLFSPAFAAFTSVSCSGLSGSSGCNSCYHQTSPLYTCNPYQSSCQKQMINEMDDTVSNTTGSEKFMRENDSGTIDMKTIQSTTEWTAKGNVGDMFSLTNEFYTPVPVGEQGYQNSSSGGFGYLLPVGTSLRWTSMEEQGGWLRPDLAKSGTVRTKPAYRVIFTPRLYTDKTHYIDHAQCVFFYVRFCGDGIVDSDRGEVCDDGNMTSGDGCTNVCQPEPACTGLSASPASFTSTGGTLTATCAGTSVSQYKFILRENLTTIDTKDYSTTNTATFTLPANTGTANKNYSVQCYVKNAQQAEITSNACIVPRSVPGVAQSCKELTVSKTAVINGGEIDYTCTANNASSTTTYSLIVRKPDNSIFVSGNTASGKITLPATPLGDYSFSCHINGSATTPDACKKTVNNSTTVEPVCSDLTISPTTLTNGGTVAFACTGSNTDSYTVKFYNPNGTVLQSFTTDRGTVTIPSTPLGTYRAECLVKNQTEAVSACKKSLTNVATPPAVTCDSLTYSTRGTRIDYTCSGSGDITSYAIYLGTDRVDTHASGSVDAGYGTHYLTCAVNNNISSNACRKQITIDRPTPRPAIDVVKDDDDNHDDIQQVQLSGQARFSVRVTNSGSEPLEAVTLSDSYAPDCNRNEASTRAMIVGVGNRDTVLDIGESFIYSCNRTNVIPSTFPNNDNTACVNGRGKTSGIAVNDCDSTRIYMGEPVNHCSAIHLTTNGNQVSATCSPSGGYRFFVLSGNKVVQGFNNANGEFSARLNDGTYKAVCLRDGEKEVNPSCTKMFSVGRDSGVCRLESTAEYGGAPLKTQLSCTSDVDAPCKMRAFRNGKIWKTFDTCSTEVEFTQKGNYDITCVVADADIRGCATKVRVDVMTEIKTGPVEIILVLLALAGASSYFVIRRRKA